MEKTTLNAKLMDMPLMQNFDKSQIATQVESFRKGEKNLFWFLKLGAFGAIGYSLWVYVLPPIFVAIGSFLAAAATALMVLGLIIAGPVLIKGIRMLTRGLHKLFIKHDPFGQLALTRVKLLQSISTFRIAKSNLISLMQDMEIEAKNSKEKAEIDQKELIRLRNSAANTRSAMEAIVTKLGTKGKEEDEYVQLNADLYKTLAKYTQIDNRIKQSENFTVKFGARGAVLKKINQRLVMVEASMDTKLSGFDSMVEGLKLEYETGRKLNAASTAARSVLGVTSDWERDYALEVISETIVNDFATSASNFKDIEMLTANYDLNSDALFDNLDAAVMKIEAGDAPLTSNTKYLNPDYVLTSNDKQQAGSNFGSMF
jgi:hypothetical protein